MIKPSNKHTSVTNILHILIALRSLLHDQFGRSHTNSNVLLFQFLNDLLVGKFSAGFSAAESTSSTMASTTPSFLESLICSNKDIGTGTH